MTLSQQHVALIEQLIDQKIQLAILSHLVAMDEGMPEKPETLKTLIERNARIELIKESLQRL